MVKCEICETVYQIKQGKISQISGPRIFILFLSIKTLCADGIEKSAYFLNW